MILQVWKKIIHFNQIKLVRKSKNKITHKISIFKKTCKKIQIIINLSIYNKLLKTIMIFKINSIIISIK